MEEETPLDRYWRERTEQYKRIVEVLAVAIEAGARRADITVTFTTPDARTVLDAVKAAACRELP
jgi:hypothetical protein